MLLVPMSLHFSANIQMVGAGFAVNNVRPPCRASKGSVWLWLFQGVWGGGALLVHDTNLKKKCGSVIYSLLVWNQCEVL